MPCISTRRAWFAASVNPSGRRSLVFSADKALNPDRSIYISCGQCIGCRLERARDWAVRCMHEASLYDDNCFITLTYDNANLPDHGDLSLRDYQLFLKRVREFARARYDVKVRFFGCGEYGDMFGRPHYHFLLFNFDFPDKVYLRTSPDGYRTYTSELLSSLWPFGLSEIGDCTFQSAGYVARYCLKKVNGEAEAEHYSYLDSEGRIRSRVKEFGTASNRPGIGAPWLAKFHTDVYNFDYVIVNGVKSSPPRYYDKKFAEIDPDEMERILAERSPTGPVAVARNKRENSLERLSVREEVLRSRISDLVR